MHISLAKIETQDVQGVLCFLFFLKFNNMRKNEKPLKNFRMGGIAVNGNQSFDVQVYDDDFMCGFNAVVTWVWISLV